MAYATRLNSPGRATSHSVYPPTTPARYSRHPHSSANGIGPTRAATVSCWEPSGISPFQLRAGREAAERGGYEHESYGATADAD